MYHQTVAMWMQLWLLGQFVSLRFKWVWAFYDYRLCCVFKASTFVILELLLLLCKKLNQTLQSELSTSAVWAIIVLFTIKSYILSQAIYSPLITVSLNFLFKTLNYNRTMFIYNACFLVTFCYPMSKTCNDGMTAKIFSILSQYCYNTPS